MPLSYITQKGPYERICEGVTSFKMPLYYEYVQLNAEPDNFENVLLYISDSMRYSAAPDSLGEYGDVLKTVSTGLATPESVGSILTGLYPSQHGVWRFSDRFEQPMQTIFDLIPSVSFDHGYGGEVLLDMYGISEDIDSSLSDIQPPFLAVVKDNLPHAPYNMTLGDEQTPSYEAYWRQRSGDPHRFQSEYHQGCQSSVERFGKLIDRLESEGVLDDTLVIFTADHGELLGEYGMVDHGAPTCPELAQVPTVFCGTEVTAKNEITSHIDLFPTIASVFDKNPGDLPGWDLFAGAPKDRLVMNHVERLHFTEQSVWDANGAYVFTDDSLLTRLRFASRHLRVRAITPQLRKHPFSVIRTLTRRSRRIGSPGISREEAKSFIEGITDQSRSQVKAELEDETVERLQNLGYHEGDEF